MFGSLLNSARGKSALTSITSRPPRPPTAIPPAPPKSPSDPAPSPKPVRPDRCCVFCGHGLYVAPKITRVRCPRCSRDLPVKDITLSGDVQEVQILTAGKIIVAQGARFHGELVACNIEIAGLVLGNVLASHCCRLRPTAKLAGNILCRHLQIEPGAVLEGQVELVRDTDPSLP